MRTVIKLDVSEEIRDKLHELVTGKQTKQLAGRVMVTDFVKGVLEGIAGAESTDIPPEPLDTELPEPYNTRYADKPATWKAGWLRGWNLVGRK